ncbi:DUF6382 domain-containing protein [Parasporobacterium paucivorans]|uniref:FHA domain-containing protein n=1 Tax=Parasporobacterium paucivorans DSM 15970 TaxID=1122934 RepID=A0A1M6JA02_9FIRM|nr:DUF6382 domain-containing protein [Parasporobacterium paucivorans]SHJ43509.1 FHA domain-containing protein [Parasporobacterium paucivorans DSM 15970]
MEAVYRHDMYHNYLVLRAGDDMESTYKYHMLINNRIKGFAKTTVRTMDNEKFLYYEISSRQTMRIMLEKEKVDYRKLKNILVCLHGCMEEANRHLLPAEDILMDPSMIFCDVEMETVEFCYYPGWGRKFMPGLNDLLQFILTRLDHDDIQATRTAYDLQMMTTRDNCTFGEIVETMMAGEPIAVSQKEDSPEIMKEMQPENLEIKKRSSFKISEPDLKKLHNATNKGMMVFGTILAMVTGTQMYRAFRDMEYGFFIPVSAAGVAVCLVLSRLSRGALSEPEEVPLVPGLEESEEKTEEKDPHPPARGNFLESQSTCGGDDVCIKDFPFTVGSLAGRVNHVIAEEGIAPMHARVIRDGEDMYLEDLNSPGGTRVNGERIEPYGRVLLEGGDRIEMAKSTYIFR